MSTDLAIRMTADVDAMVGGFDDGARAAKELDDAVDKAASTAASSAGKFDAVGEGADGLADKSSKATGALGALSSGLTLVGLESYAAGLEGAAMATDFFSGVGDSLTLVMELGAVAKAKDAAAAAAHAVATGVQTTATTVATTAQAAFNTVMALNPIALVVIAVVALVAGFVLLYNKSETVREAVAKVGEIGKQAIGFVVDKVKDLIGWLADKLLPSWVLLRTTVTAVVSAIVERVLAFKDRAVELFGAVVDRGREIWDQIRDKVSDVRDSIVDRITALRDTLVEKFVAIKDKGREIWDDIKDKVDTIREGIATGIDTLRETVSGYFEKMMTPIDAAVAKVRDLIDLINKIPGVDIPGGNSRVALPTPASTSDADAAFADRNGRAASQVVTINFNGLVTDPVATAAEIRRVLRRADGITL